MRGHNSEGKANAQDVVPLLSLRDRGRAPDFRPPPRTHKEPVLQFYVSSSTSAAPRGAYEAP